MRWCRACHLARLPRRGVSLGSALINTPRDQANLSHVTIWGAAASGATCSIAARFVPMTMTGEAAGVNRHVGSYRLTGPALVGRWFASRRGGPCSRGAPARGNSFRPSAPHWCPCSALISQVRRSKRRSPFSVGETSTTRRSPATAHESRARPPATGRPGEWCRPTGSRVHRRERPSAVLRERPARHSTHKHRVLRVRYPLDSTRSFNLLVELLTREVQRDECLALQPIPRRLSLHGQHHPPSDGPSGHRGAGHQRTLRLKHLGKGPAQLTPRIGRTAQISPGHEPVRTYQDRAVRRIPRTVSHRHSGSR